MYSILLYPLEMKKNNLIQKKVCINYISFHTKSKEEEHCSFQRNVRQLI